MSTQSVFIQEGLLLFIIIRALSLPLFPVGKASSFRSLKGWEAFLRQPAQNSLCISKKDTNPL